MSVWVAKEVMGRTHNVSPSPARKGVVMQEEFTYLSFFGGSSSISRTSRIRDLLEYSGVLD